MSLREKYLKGWGFRTARPTFEPGDEISVFITGFEGGYAVARIGDTKIRVPGVTDEEMVDTRVRLRVTEFDAADSVGEAEYIEYVGESAF